MLIDFNQNQYIEQVKTNNKIEELQHELNICIGKIAYIKDKEEDKKVLQTQLDKDNSFFYRWKNRKKRRNIKNQIDSIQSIIDNGKKYIELEQKLKTEMLELRNKKTDYVINDAFTYDDNGLIINDEFIISESNNASNEKVIVHCTNFFPKNRVIQCNYDGNDIIELDCKCNEKNKKVSVVSHRHTVHFTINSVVKTNANTVAAGKDWGQPKFVIIEPLMEHKEQFVSDLNTHSDSYTYGSVKLCERPLLLVRDDSFDEIPKDEVTNYNIIRYRGDYEKCTKNLLQYLKYRWLPGDASASNHEHSIEGKTEGLLDARNIIINYALDNKYDGKNDISFSIREMSKIYDTYLLGVETKKMATLNGKDYEVYERIIPNHVFDEKIYDMISDKTKIPVDYLKFCIDFGIYKVNNEYKIYDDDMMYRMLKEYKKLKTSIESKSNDDRIRTKLLLDNINYDYNNIKQFRDDYHNYVTLEKEHNKDNNSDFIEESEKKGQIKL